MKFREVWARVADYAGEEFQLASGEQFSYTFKRTFVLVSPGGLSLPKTNFEKVHRLGIDAQVQGRKHIRLILEDPRVAQPASETE